MRREFDVPGFIDEMRAQDIVNRLVGSIADAHRKTPLDCFTQEDITDFCTHVPRDLRKYTGRIPIVKPIYGGDKFDFVLPFKESDSFDPDQKIIDIFNPGRDALSGMDVGMDALRVADNSLLKLFNQTGRPQGLVIATESLTGLTGFYYLRSYQMKDEAFRNVREGSIGYHPNVYFGLANPRDTTLREFIQLVASAITYHEL